MEIYYWAAPLLLVGSWAASFLGSYLKQKGENLATREDLDDLVKQTAALTETTKRIEAEISEATWGRQKRSEMKIDALVQALSALSQLEDALLDLDSASSIDSSFERSRSASEWSVASSRFDTAVVMARIVCKDVGPAILQAGQQIRGERIGAGSKRGLDDAGSYARHFC